MKKTFLSALRAMCAGVMTLCMGSLAFVSCYDDTELQNKYKDLDGRLAVVEQLAKALEERADDALYTLEFQISSSNELQYSFDGGETWNATGVTATDGISVSDVEDDDDSITFIFSDGSSFTVEKPVEVQFEIRSGKVYFGDDNETRTIKVLTSGISDLTAFAAPRGWFAEVNADGNVEVTSPAEDDNNAVSSGYVKLHACGQDGKCYVGRFLVEKSVSGGFDIAAFAGKAVFNNKGQYYFGISESVEALAEDTEYLRNTLSGNPDWEWLGNHPSNMDKEGNPTPKTVVSLAELFGNPLTEGATYVVWALRDSSQDEYTVEDLVYTYYTHTTVSVTSTEDITKKTARDTEVSISVTGADRYAVYFISGSYLITDNPEADPEEYRTEMINTGKEELINSLEYIEFSGNQVFDEDYNGPLSGLKASYDTDPISVASDNVVLILPIDGRPFEYYTIDDVSAFEYSTAPYSSGGAANVTASILTEGTYTQWGMEKDVNLQEAIVASVNIPEGTEWSELYYGFVSDKVWTECSNDDQKLVDYFSENSWPTTPVMEGMTTTFPLYDSYYDIEVDSSVQFVAFAVDAQGKYGTVAKVQFNLADVPTPSGKLWAFQGFDMFSTTQATNVLSLGAATLSGFWGNTLTDVFTWGQYNANNFPEEEPYMLLANTYYSQMGAANFTVKPKTATSGTVSFTYLGAFDDEGNYTQNEDGSFVLVEGQTDEFEYENYNAEEGTVTLYFYDTENGDQCSLMTDQIEIVYYNPVGAMKN